MKLDAMAVTMPLVRDHPNRVPFEGVLTYVDVPSDRAPSGSRGRRVILTRGRQMQRFLRCWAWRWIFVRAGTATMHGANAGLSRTRRS